MKFFKYIDYFGNTHKLNIGGIENYKTYIGEIFSIILFCLMISLAWYFGKDIYEKTNQKYLSNTLSTDKFPFINLNTSEFYYAFRIEDSYNELINDTRFYDVEIYYKYFSNVNGTTIEERKEIKTEFCNEKPGL